MMFKKLIVTTSHMHSSRAREYGSRTHPSCSPANQRRSQVAWHATRCTFHGLNESMRVQPGDRHQDDEAEDNDVDDEAEDDDVDDETVIDPFFCHRYPTGNYSTRETMQSDYSSAAGTNSVH